MLAAVSADTENLAFGSFLAFPSCCTLYGIVLPSCIGKFAVGSCIEIVLENYINITKATTGKLNFIGIADK